MSIFIGEVKNVEDYEGGERIKVRIGTIDGDKTIKDSDLPYAFPLLPKSLHIKPKVGEAVLVLCANDENKHSQRYYIGPIISQPQFMWKDDYLIGATKLLRGGRKEALETPISNIASADGVLATNDEVAIYGRLHSDIILSDNDLRIRCGCKITDENNKENVEFNKKNPTFLKMKRHDIAFSNQSQSTATLVSEEINLISTVGDGEYTTNLFDTNEQINDETMQKIINKAHVLPYGDVLIHFLSMFLQMFKAHTHNYHNLPPVVDNYSLNLNREFGQGDEVVINEINKPLELKNQYTMTDISSGKKIEDVSKTFSKLGEKILSKHIRIN